MQRVGEVVIKTEKCTSQSPSTDFTMPLDCRSRDRLICLGDLSKKSVGRMLLATASSTSHSPPEAAHCRSTEHPLVELSPQTWSDMMMRRTADIGTEQLPDQQQQNTQTQQLGKLKRFLATIQQFGDGLSVEIGDLVRGLVVAVATNVIGVEEFHDRLRKATNLPLRPFVIPFLQTTLPLLREELGFDFNRPSFDASPPRCNGTLARLGGSRSPPEAAAPPNDTDAKTSIGVDGQSNKSGDEIRFDLGHVTEAGDSNAWIRDAVSGRLKTSARRASDDRWNKNVVDPSQPVLKRQRYSLDRHDSGDRDHADWQLPDSDQPSGGVGRRVESDARKRPLSIEILLRSKSAGHVLPTTGTVLPPNVGRRQLNESLSCGWLSQEQEQVAPLNLHRHTSIKTSDSGSFTTTRWQHVNQLLDEIVRLVGRCQEALYRLQQHSDRKEVRKHASIGATSGDVINSRHSSNVENEAVISADETRRLADSWRAELHLLPRQVQIGERDIPPEVHPPFSSTAPRRPPTTSLASVPPTPTTATPAAATGMSSDDLEQLLADVRQRTTQEVEALVNRQENSIECCWNCGRTASETCSGCRRARYCGTFCQHRHWRSHHRSCHPVAPDTDTADSGQNTSVTDALIAVKTTPADPPTRRIVDDEREGVQQVHRGAPIGDPDRRSTPATPTWDGDDRGKGDATRGSHRSSQRRGKYRRAVVTEPSRDDARTATVTSSSRKHQSGRRELPTGGPRP